MGRYRVLYLLSALELTVIIAWALYYNILGDPDRVSYYEAYDVIMSGRIDEVRTPLYPLIIGIPKSIFGEGLSKAVVYIFQALIFLFSIKWFGKTLDNIVSHKRISYWFTAIYALYPGMLTYCGMIMTESLSISLMTAVTYLVSEAYYHNSFKKGILSGVVCLLLWMLRPSMLSVTLIMLVFWMCLWIFRDKRLRKTVVCGFCATLVSLAGMGVYSLAFYNEYHKTGMTCVSTWNNYHLIRKSGVMDTDLAETPEIKATVDSIIANNATASEYENTRHWKESEQLHKTLGLIGYDNFVNQQIKLHKGEIIAYIYQERLEDLLDDDCVFTGNGGYLPFFVCSLTRLIRVNNGTAFLIFLIGLSLLTYTNLKNRKISYFIWVLYACFAAAYLTIWLGAPNAFTRLAASNYPVLLAISCRILNMLVCLASDAPSSEKISGQNEVV